MRRKLLYLFLALGLSVYGIAIGRYEVFPFSYIQNFKRHLVGYTPEDKSPNGKVGFLDFPALKSKPVKPENKLGEMRNNPSWRAEVSYFNRLRTKPDIVMLGDSITNAARWHEVFPGAKIIDRAISGDTTTGILERIDEIERRKPKLVFLMIGINDITDGVPLDKIYRNYIEILTRLKEHNIKTVVQSTIHVGANYHAEAKKIQQINEQVRQLNSMLLSYCSDHGMIFIDLNKRLAPEGVLKQEFTYDGVHLDIDAYQIWANEIKEYVQKAARATQNVSTKEERVSHSC